MYNAIPQTLTDASKKDILPCLGENMRVVWARALNMPVAAAAQIGGAAQPSSIRLGQCNKPQNPLKPL
jgi:hypothetical protein